MNHDKKIAATIALYVVCGAITYGHAFVNLSAKQPIDMALIGSMASAFLWPMYVSVQFWK